MYDIKRVIVKSKHWTVSCLKGERRTTAHIPFNVEGKAPQEGKKMKRKFEGLSHASTMNTQLLADYSHKLSVAASEALMRGGVVKRLTNALARGSHPDDAMAEAVKFGKGYAGEALVAEDFNYQAGLLRHPYRMQLNPNPTDPKHDLILFDQERAVLGEQIKVGSRGYVGQSARSGKYRRVIADQEAVQQLPALVEQGVLTDRFEYGGVKGSPLTRREAERLARQELYRLGVPEGKIERAARVVGAEAYYLVHNVLHSGIFSLCMNTLVEFMSKPSGKIDWDDITSSTFRTIKNSMEHYAITRSISLSLQQIATQCAGSLWGRAAQFLLRRGAWISAGVSAGLAINEDYQEYQRGRMSGPVFCRQTGRNVGSAFGGVGGAIVGARLGASFGPVGILVGLFLGSIGGSYIAAEAGGFVGEVVADLIYDPHLPAHLPSPQPYLLIPG